MPSWPRPRTMWDDNPNILISYYFFSNPPIPTCKNYRWRRWLASCATTWRRWSPQPPCWLEHDHDHDDHGEGDGEGGQAGRARGPGGDSSPRVWAVPGAGRLNYVGDGASGMKRWMVSRNFQHFSWNSCSYIAGSSLSTPCSSYWSPLTMLSLSTFSSYLLWILPTSSTWRWTLINNNLTRQQYLSCSRKGSWKGYNLGYSWSFCQRASRKLKQISFSM